MNLQNKSEFKKFVKQLFCSHDYEWDHEGGFAFGTCPKCDKTITKVEGWK